MGAVLKERLIMCSNCQSHACVIFSNGASSEDFHSIRSGLLTVETALVSGVIAEPEASYLREVVKKCRLPLLEDVEEVSFGILDRLLQKLRG